jgi:hypothetical protein
LCVKAVIEVCSADNGNLPVDLLKVAYFASRTGTVVLVLSNVSAEQVDAVLDPFVAQLPRDIPGVRYISVKEQAAILNAAAQSENVFAKFGSRGMLRPLLAQARVESMPLARAAAVLGGLQ